LNLIADDAVWSDEAIVADPRTGLTTAVG